jgi:hypothetical protein
MAKSKTLEEEKLTAQLLDGLRKGLDSNPHRLQGTPKNPGLFPGGKAGEKLAQRALEGGLVRQVPSPEPPPQKKGTKPPVYVSLTDRGHQLVLESDSPLKALTALRETLEVQGSQLAKAVQTAAEETAAWREKVEQFQQGIRNQFTHYQQLSQAFQAMLDRLGRQSPAPPPQPLPIPPHPGKPPEGWLDEVVRIVAEQKKHNSFDRPTLTRVYEQLKKSQPGLTLGQFHDGLRALLAQRRIRLTAYTQTLATLPDAQNALYLDREVKYYVDLP